ncbi:hypothetical protein Tco_0231974 [Tanacetum coccineum]
MTGNTKNASKLLKEKCDFDIANDEGDGEGSIQTMSASLLINGDRRATAFNVDTHGVFSNKAWSFRPSPFTFSRMSPLTSCISP